MTLPSETYPRKTSSPPLRLTISRSDVFDQFGVHSNTLLHIWSINLIPHVYLLDPQEAEKMRAQDRQVAPKAESKMREINHQ